MGGGFGVAAPARRRRGYAIASVLPALILVAVLSADVPEAGAQVQSVSDASHTLTAPADSFVIDFDNHVFVTRAGTVRFSVILQETPASLANDHNLRVTTTNRVTNNDGQNISVLYGSPTPANPAGLGYVPMRFEVTGTPMYGTTSFDFTSTTTSGSFENRDGTVFVTFTGDAEVQDHDTTVHIRDGTFQVDFGPLTSGTGLTRVVFDDTRDSLRNDHGVEITSGVSTSARNQNIAAGPDSTVSFRLEDDTARTFDVRYRLEAQGFTTDFATITVLVTDVDADDLSVDVVDSTLFAVDFGPLTSGTGLDRIAFGDSLDSLEGDHGVSLSTLGVRPGARDSPIMADHDAVITFALQDGARGSMGRVVEVPYTLHASSGATDTATLTFNVRIVQAADHAAHVLSSANAFTLRFSEIIERGTASETVRFDDTVTGLAAKGLRHTSGATDTAGVLTAPATAIVSFELVNSDRRTETLGYDLVYDTATGFADDPGTITVNIGAPSTIGDYTAYVANTASTFDVNFADFISVGPPGSETIRITDADLAAAGLGVVLDGTAASRANAQTIQIDETMTATFTLVDSMPRTETLPITLGLAGFRTTGSFDVAVITPVGTANDLTSTSVTTDSTTSFNFQTITGGTDSGTVAFDDTRGELAAKGLGFDPALGFSEDTATGVISGGAGDSVLFDITDKAPRQETLGYTLRSVDPSAALQTGTITFILSLPAGLHDASYDIAGPRFTLDTRLVSGSAGLITVTSATMAQLADMGVTLLLGESPGSSTDAQGRITTTPPNPLVFALLDSAPGITTLTLSQAGVTGSSTVTVNLHRPPASPDFDVDATNAMGMAGFALDFDTVYGDVHDGSSPVTTVTFYSDSARSTAATLSDLGLTITGDTATENTDNTITVTDPDGMATFTSANQDARTIYASYTATVTPPTAAGVGTQMSTGDITVTVPVSPSVTMEVDHGDFTVDFGGILGDLTGRTISFAVRGEGPLSDEDLELVSGATEETVGEGETRYNVEAAGMVVLRSTSATERPVTLDYRVTGTGPTMGDITLNINVPPVAQAIAITRDNDDAFSLDFKEHFSDADQTDETTHTITFEFDGTATAATSGLGISGADLSGTTYTVTNSERIIQFTITETSPTRTVDLSYTVEDANSNTGDTGAIRITIDIPPPPPVQQTCDNSQAGTLDFGSLEDGGTSAEQTLAIRNSGNTDSTIMISGTDWADAGTTQMGAGQTRVGTETGGYGSKTALTTEAAELFSITAGESSNAFLQLQAQLADSEFEGNLSQTITITSTCDDGTTDGTAGTAPENAPAASPPASQPVAETAAVTEVAPRTAASAVEEGQEPAKGVGTAPADQTLTDTAPAGQTQDGAAANPQTDTAAGQTDTAPAGQTQAASTPADTAPADQPAADPQDTGQTPASTPADTAPPSPSP